MPVDAVVQLVIPEALQYSPASAVKKYALSTRFEVPVLWMPNPVYQISSYRSELQGVDPQDPMNLMYFQDWSWKS